MVLMLCVVLVLCVVLCDVGVMCSLVLCMVLVLCVVGIMCGVGVIYGVGVMCGVGAMCGIGAMCGADVALHASVVHASGSGQLQANPHVVGQWLSPGKPSQRAVTTMGSNDLFVGEVHMLGPSYQRYNWHTGRCGSIAFGSSPRRGKTLISNRHCLAEVSTRGKDFRR